MNSSSEKVTEENFDPSEKSSLAFAVGFFFSARAIVALFLVRVLGTDPSAGAGTALILSFLLFGFTYFDSLGPEKRTFSSMLQVPSVRWVLVFLTFSACSLTWSVTVSPAVSIAYWFGMASDVAIVVLMLRGGSVTGISHSVMKGFIWGTCLLALIAWLMPAQSDLRLGDEDFFNANQIGNLCAFAIFLAQYLMRRKDGRWGLIALFLVVTLIRSLSKTTIAAFLLSESFLLIQDRSISRKTKILLTTAAMLAILVFWGLFEAYYDIYTSNADQAETLTGRTAIWAYVSIEALEKPWIGHGFDSMWKVIPPFGLFEARHAENELLQQFYTYGAVGIVMLVGLYGSLYQRIRKLPRGPLKIIFTSIVIFVIVRGIAEAEPFDLLLPLWSIVLISMLVDRETTTDQEMAIVSPSTY